MKTFETYVQEQCPGEYATNNSPEGFERWLEQLDVQEVMDMAEAYGKDVEQEVVQRVRGVIEKELKLLSSAYAGLETLPEKSANLAIRDSFIRILSSKTNHSHKQNY